MTMEQLQPIDRFLMMIENETKTVRENNKDSYFQKFGFLKILITEYSLNIGMVNGLNINISLNDKPLTMDYGFLEFTEEYRLKINGITLYIPKHMIDYYF